MSTILKTMWKLIKKLFLIIIFLGGLFIVHYSLFTNSVFAVTCTAASDGDWRAITWTGCDGAGYPVSGDAAVIGTTRAITIANGQTDAADSLTFTAGASTLTITGTLNISGAVTQNNAANATWTNTIAGTGTLNTATVVVGGTTALTGTNTARVTTLVSTITAFNVSGNVTITGVDPGTPDNDGYLNLNAGTMDVDGVITRTPAGQALAVLRMNQGAQTGTLVISNASPFSGSGTFTPAGSGATVNYNGTDQAGYVATYTNLTISTSGTKTFATTPTVNGIFLINGTAIITVTTGVVTYGAAATLQYSTTTSRTASSEEWLTTFAGTGGVIINSTGTITLNEAKIFGSNSPLTIMSGATLNTDAANNYGLTFGGHFVNNGGTFTANASPIVIANTMASQNIAGFTTTGDVSMTKTAQTATFTGAVNGGSLTMNGNGGTLNLGTSLTHTFTGTWTRTNGTLNGGTTSTINFSKADTVFSGTGGTFTAGTGTVGYTNAAAQTFPTLTYNNLTLSGGGVKTVDTTPTVNGILTLGGTATITVTTGVVTYGASATLQYQNSDARTASSEEWITPFAATGGVIIDNTANSVTLNGAKVFNASIPLLINDSTAALLTNNYQMSFGGNFTNNGGTFTAGSSNIVIGNGTMATQNIAGFTTTGTVTMTKTGGTATLQAAVSAGALTMNGTGGTLNLGASLTHGFTSVTLTAGTLDGGSSILNNTGDWSDGAGAFTASTSTINFTSTAATQNITGTAATQTFNNLGITKSAQILTCSSSTTTLTVGGTFILTSGVFNPGTCTTLNVTGTTTLSAGTFNITNMAVNLGGDYTVASGLTLTTTGSTTTFNSTTADQNINGTIATNSFNALTVNKSGFNLIIGGNTTTVNIAGTITLTAGTLQAGTAANINVGGNFANNSGAAAFTPGSGTVSLNGSGAQAINGSQSTTFNHLTIANTAATVNGAGNFSVAGTLTVNSLATFAPSGTATFTGTAWTIVNNYVLTFSAVTIAGTPASQPTANFNIGGALTVNSGVTFAPGATSVITMNTGSSIVNNGGATTNLVFYGLTIASGATVTSSTAFSIAATLTNSATATFNPTGLITMSAAGSGISNSGTSLLFDGGLTISTTPTAQTQYNTSFSVDGTFTIGAGVTYAPTSGTITFTSGSITNNNSLTFNGLTISTGTVTSGSSFSVNGNWTNTGTFTQSAGTVTFNGSGAQAITGTNNNFTNLTISAAATRTVTITSDGVLSVAANGTLTLTGTDSSNKLTLLASSTNPWQLHVSTTSPTFSISHIVVDNSDASGYQEIDATGGTNSGTNTTNWDFGAPPAGCYWVGGTSIAWETGGNWTGCAGVGGVPDTTDTVTIITGSFQPTLSSTVTVAGMTLTSGTLTIASSYTLNVTGNWTNNGGTLASTSGTVSLNGTGTQIVSGSTTFYNLSITASSARTILFVGGSTTVSIANNGSLTFQGAFGNLLTLNSDNHVTWNLQVSNTNTTVSVTYSNVSYSNASGYKQIVADGGTNIDSGNNTNWSFGTASDQNKKINFGEGLNFEGVNIN